MSQDILADALNQIMNMKKAGKSHLTLKKYSNVLLSVLAIAKLKNHIKNYEVKDNNLHIEIGKLNGCNAIKPRFVVKVNDIDKYVQRYLPAKTIGTLILSTSHGMMTHQTAQEKNIGGMLIAYIY